MAETGEAWSLARLSHRGEERGAVISTVPPQKGRHVALHGRLADAEQQGDVEGRKIDREQIQNPALDLRLHALHRIDRRVCPPVAHRPN